MPLQAQAGPPAKVLIVDDQPANLLALESVLHPLGAHLVRAPSGEEALACLLDADFAAILLDVRMPGLDGFQTARLVRERPRSRTTPILFVTAADSTAPLLEEAYALGAVDFLTKPLNPAMLKAKVAFFIELQRSREELRAAERRAVNEHSFLRAVLDAVQDPILACDAGGRITLFNRAARALHGAGLPPAQWAGLYRVAEGNGSRRMAPEEAPLVRALAGERVRHAEVLLESADGRTLTLLASGQPIHDKANGEQLGAVLSMHDLTAQRIGAAARELAVREQARREAAEAAADRLRASEEKLRQLAEELAQSDRRKSEFLATLAHELRNPLAPLRNGLYLLHQAQDEQARARTWAMMDRQLGHLVRLVDDLLDVARVGSGKLALHKERIELRPLVERAVETVQPLMDQAGHQLQVELPPEPLWLEADATRMAQVLSNLLSNAAKYTPDHGHIRLGARREGGQLCLEVQDDGVGLRPEELARVFQMFTQFGHEGAHAPAGLGIGLALVRALLEMHGGSIRADSPGPGRGSTFTVRMPLSPSAHPAVSAAPGPELDLEPDGHAGLQVLVVDDNPDAAESLALILQMDGHVARVAHDGRQALALARRFQPQVVFLDIGMPGMDGYEVARALQRENQDRPRPVLVALTGWGARDDLARARAAGFDHHLTKPADIAAVEKLLATLRAEA